MVVEQEQEQEGQKEEEGGGLRMRGIFSSESSCDQPGLLVFLRNVSAAGR